MHRALALPNTVLELQADLCSDSGVPWPDEWQREGRAFAAKAIDRVRKERLREQQRQQEQALEKEQKQQQQQQWKEDSFSTSSSGLGHDDATALQPFVAPDLQSVAFSSTPSDLGDGAPSQALSAMDEDQVLSFLEHHVVVQPFGPLGDGVGTDGVTRHQYGSLPTSQHSDYYACEPDGHIAPVILQSASFVSSPICLLDTLTLRDIRPSGGGVGGPKYVLPKYRCQFAF